MRVQPVAASVLLAFGGTIACGRLLALPDDNAPMTPDGGDAKDGALAPDAATPEAGDAAPQVVGADAAVEASTVVPSVVCTDSCSCTVAPCSYRCDADCAVSCPNGVPVTGTCAVSCTGVDVKVRCNSGTCTYDATCASCTKTGGICVPR